MSKARLTTRIARKRNSAVRTGMTVLHELLAAFILGDHAESIRLINSIRPKDIVEYITGESGDDTLYLDALSNIPEDMQAVYQTAKLWQDVAAAARKMLQGKSMATESDVLKSFKKFISMVENVRV